jgi:hypothetical protein
MSLNYTASISELEGFKVSFRQRSHSPLCMPKYDHLSASRILHAPEQNSIVLGEGGRRKFEPRHSLAQEYRPAKRPLTPPKRNNSPPHGKRYIPVKDHSEDDHTSSKKMFAAFAMKKSESTDLPAIGWKKRGQVFDADGKPVKDKESQPYNLEATMNRKQRVSGELENRNFIPAATAGDKPLRRAEETPGYYADGGLIPGSTIQERKTTNPLANKSTVQFTSSKKLEATYGTMQKRLQAEYDRRQVESLTVRKLSPSVLRSC